jgi:hypothetical protein
VSDSTSGGLTADEIDALLRRPVPARLATLDSDGYPSIVPVWLEWDGSTAWIVARAMAERHEGAAGLAYIEQTLDWPRVLVAITVQQVRSWGSPDWHPRYRPPDTDPRRADP